MCLSLNHIVWAAKVSGSLCIIVYMYKLWQLYIRRINTCFPLYIFSLGQKARKFCLGDL